MTFNPQPLIRLVGSRVFAVTLIAVSVAATLLGGFGTTELPVVDRGFGLPSPALWFGSPTVSLWVNLSSEVLAIVGIYLLNRAFNLFRGLRGGSLLMSALFMLMQGASPAASRFSGGSLLLLTIIFAVAVMFGIYQRFDGNRRIFLVFCLLGTGALTQYGFLPYLAVMMLGVMQMRVMSLRAIIAILAGIATPLWILWGSGLMKLTAPPLDQLTRLFDPGIIRSAVSIALAGLVSMFVGFVSGFLDMVQIYARNAVTRARFGLLATTGLFTGVLCLIDFSNIEFYLPLLNLTTSFFVTLLFSLRQRDSLGTGTVAIVILTLLSAALYIWKIISSLV